MKEYIFNSSCFFSSFLLLIFDSTETIQNFLNQNQTLSSVIMRQLRILILLLVLLIGAVVFLGLKLVDERYQNTLLQSKLIGHAATCQSEREKREDELSGLQTKFEGAQRELASLRNQLAERIREVEICQAKADQVTKDLMEAQNQRNTAAMALVRTSGVLEEKEKVLAECEEAREQCVKGEIGKADSKEQLLDELQVQNERLGKKSQELQLKIQQLKDDCDQSHWKSEGEHSWVFTKKTTTRFLIA
jgi:hypothetical protein